MHVIDNLPEECVAECSAPGQPADEAVAYWLAQPEVAAIIGAVPAEDLRRHLNEYGAWEADDLADDHANRERLLWLAACDMREGGEHYID